MSSICIFTLQMILLLGLGFLFKVELLAADQVTNNRIGSGICPLKEPRVVDWAYSPADLSLLTKFEGDLYKEFGESTKKELPFFERSALHAALQEWISDYSTTSLQSVKLKPDTEWSGIYTHPFLSYNMLNRFKYLGVILNHPGVPIQVETNEGGFFQMVMDFGTKVELPNFQDVRNTMYSILAIKFIYGFPIDEYLRGKFGDVDTSVGLELEDAYELGRISLNQGMFAEALDWLRTAYTRLSAEPKDRPSSMTNETVLELILEVVRQHDLLIDRIAADPSLDRYIGRFNHKISSKEKLLTKKKEGLAKFRKTKDPNLLLPIYCLLCSGKDFQAERLRPNLRCWYEHASDPAWTINPLKVEVLSMDPYLLQIYEVIGNKTIDILRKAAAPDMARAPTVSQGSTGTSEDHVSTYRTATRAYLLEDVEETRDVLRALNRRIGSMTGLAVSNVEDPFSTASEPLQISSYSVGGEFGIHMDQLEGMSDPTGHEVGDRVATFMIYLNDVYRGGYTVFSTLGLSIRPEKGSAIFWYGLFRNGTVDKRTMHAGCPVILGEKWIATKWIRLYASFQKRACSLDPLE